MQTTGQQFQLNVCGLTNYKCVPNWPVYDNYGVAVQILSAAPSPNPGCMDTTGATVPCSGQCVVLGTDFFKFALLDETNPATGGVVLSHTGMPPDADDPFPCPAMTPNGLTQERQLAIMIKCNAAVSGLQVLNVTEPSPCSYLVTAQSSAACAATGDPFDLPAANSGWLAPGQYRDDPGHSFGFVILGVFLSIVVYYVVKFGNARGWWEPVLRFLPASLRGTSGSSYKTINTSSAATPISASAYGTA